MWLLVSKADSATVYTIIGGRKYVVGRQNCDINIADASVSRQQAELTMIHQLVNVEKPYMIPMLTLKDISKFGTFVNGNCVRNTQTKTVGLNDGDEIKFGGSPVSVYRVKYEPFVLTTSCIKRASKKDMCAVVCQLGGHLVKEWRTNCEMLIMSQLSVTIKVVCALNSQKYIVTSQYLDDLCAFHMEKRAKPDPAEYLPNVVDEGIPEGVSFLPDPRRATTLSGLKVYFLCAVQFKKTNLAVSTAGGQPILQEDGTEVDVEDMTVGNTLVVSVGRDTLGTLSPACQKFVQLVLTTLTRKGMRMVSDPEVGWATLTCNVEKFCNPFSEMAPTMYADIASQMTQFSQTQADTSPSAKKPPQAAAPHPADVRRAIPADPLRPTMHAYRQLAQAKRPPTPPDGDGPLFPPPPHVNPHPHRPPPSRANANQAPSASRAEQKQSDNPSAPYAASPSTSLGAARTTPTVRKSEVSDEPEVGELPAPSSDSQEDNVPVPNDGARTENSSTVEASTKASQSESKALSTFSFDNSDEDEMSSRSSKRGLASRKGLFDDDEMGSKSSKRSAERNKRLLDEDEISRKKRKLRNKRDKMIVHYNEKGEIVDKYYGIPNYTSKSGSKKHKSLFVDDEDDEIGSTKSKSDAKPHKLYDVEEFNRIVGESGAKKLEGVFDDSEEEINSKAGSSGAKRLKGVFDDDEDEIGSKAGSSGAKKLKGVFDDDEEEINSKAGSSGAKRLKGVFDDDEEEINSKAGSSGAKKLKGVFDDDEEEISSKAGSSGAKRLKGVFDDEDDIGSKAGSSGAKKHKSLFSFDDDEDEMDHTKRRGGAQKRRALFSFDDEEDADDGPSSHTSRAAKRPHLSTDTTSSVSDKNENIVKDIPTSSRLDSKQDLEKESQPETIQGGGKQTLDTDSGKRSEPRDSEKKSDHSERVGDSHNTVPRSSEVHPCTDQEDTISSVKPGQGWLRARPGLEVKVEPIDDSCVTDGTLQEDTVVEKKPKKVRRYPNRPDWLMDLDEEEDDKDSLKPILDENQDMVLDKHGRPLRHLCEVKTVSLVARPSGTRPKTQHTASESPSTSMKNFKTFRKTQHTGSGELPTIIGGRDLEVYTGDRHQDIEHLFSVELDEENERTKDERRGRQLFDWEPAVPKKTSRKKVR